MTLFLVGLVSLLSQVVLLRELNVAFYGIELVYLVALAAWLGGTAAGAALGGAGTSGTTTSAATAAWQVTTAARGARWLLAVIAVLLPLEIAFVRGSRLLFGAVAGAYLPIERQVLVLLLAVVPIAGLSGLAFRRAARVQAAAGGRLATAYAVESAGAAVGGLVSTLAFRAGAQTLTLAVVTTFLTLACLAISRGPARSPGAPGRLDEGSRPAARPGIGWSRVSALLDNRLLSLIVIAVAALLALWRVGAVDRGMTRWTHPALALTLDTPYGRASLERRDAQVTVFENDVLTYESETAVNEVLPHLAALQHEAPRGILLLGGSVELLDRELAMHRPETLDQVELDETLVAATHAVLGREAPRPGALRIADPRAFLRAPAVGGILPSYDVIVVAMPEPVSGQTNRFYTREFFEECARRLSPRGVIGLRLQVPENYLTPASVLRSASIAQALRATFPFVEFLPGAATVAVASGSPLPDRDTLVERLRSRRLTTRLVTPAYVEYVYDNDRRQELHEALLSARVPINRDRQPITYLYAAVGWLSKFVPTLIGMDGAVLGRPAGWPAALRWGPLVLLPLLFAVARLRPAARRAALAAAAGFGGMALETVLLLDYQAKSGALFEDLGLLVMAFMAGSAVGASVMAGTRSPRARATLLLIALGAAGLLSAWLVDSGARTGLAPGLLLLFGIGALVSGLFACVSGVVRADDEGGMGRLYGADVLGGCLGSLAASLVLIPLAGLDVTAWVVAAISLLAMLAV